MKTLIRTYLEKHRSRKQQTSLPAIGKDVSCCSSFGVLIFGVGKVPKKTSLKQVPLRLCYELTGQISRSHAVSLAFTMSGHGMINLIHTPAEGMQRHPEILHRMLVLFLQSVETHIECKQTEHIWRACLQGYIKVHYQIELTCLWTSSMKRHWNITWLSLKSWQNLRISWEHKSPSVCQQRAKGKLESRCSVKW